MGSAAPRLVVGGIALLVVALMLRQTGITPWAALVAFIGGVALLGRGFLRITAGSRQGVLLAPVDSLAEVGLSFPAGRTSWRIEGASLPSPGGEQTGAETQGLIQALALLSIIAQDAETPALVATSEQEDESHSLLRVFRTGENSYRVLAQRWTGTAVLRFTGEAERGELEQAIKESNHGVNGESDTPGRHRHGEQV